MYKSQVCKEMCVVIQGELVGTQKGQQRPPILPSMSIEELGLMSEPHYFSSTLSAWDQGHCLIAVLPFDKLNKYFLRDAAIMLRVNEYLKDVAWPREKRIEKMLATSDAAMVLQVIDSSQRNPQKRFCHRGKYLNRPSTRCRLDTFASREEILWVFLLNDLDLDVMYACLADIVAVQPGEEEGYEPPGRTPYLLRCDDPKVLEGRGRPKEGVFRPHQLYKRSRMASLAFSL